MPRALLVALGLAAATPAHALDAYMWGVGPRVGTNAIPGRYPSKFPDAVVRNVENSGIERVRNDLVLGAEGVYYVNGSTRALLSAGLGFGSGYFDAHVLLKYNYVVQTGAMDFLFGAGAGAGSARWKGTGPERLVTPYYPIRAEASALIRDDQLGYQLSIFAQYNIPSSHTYVNHAGLEVGEVSGGIFATVGIEASVYYGDFTPPKRKKKGSGSDAAVK